MSKVTGHLGDRVEDLERANESVAVRLANLRRAGSVKSTVSSTMSIDSQDFKQQQHRKRHTSSSPSRARSLFQNKCVQMILLAMISIIAISLLSMATVYIIDYYDRQNNNDRSVFVNETSSSLTEIKIFEKDDKEILVNDNKLGGGSTILTSPLKTTTYKTPFEDKSTIRSSFSLSSTSSLGTDVSSMPPSMISSGLVVIGALSDADELRCSNMELDLDKCQSVCCGVAVEQGEEDMPPNDSNNELIEGNSNFYLNNDVFLVEPEQIHIITTPLQQSTSPPIMTTDNNKETLAFDEKKKNDLFTSSSTTEASKVTTISSADVEKKLEQLLISGHNEEIEKENQVLEDDVTKPLDSNAKEQDKQQDKVTISKDMMMHVTSTEKSSGLQQHKLSKVNAFTNSLKKDNSNLNTLSEDEQFNEVLDHISSAEEDKNDTVSSNMTTQTQESTSSQLAKRARRDINFNDLGQQIGHFVKGLVRRIRDTGQSLSLDKRQTRYHLTLAGTSIGNVTLDHQFCDRMASSTQLNDCLQGYGFNTSLEIPLSRHFKDSDVKLNIKSSSESSSNNNPESVIIMCPMDSSVLNRCSGTSQDPDLSAVTEGSIPGQFHINVGQFHSIQVKFRKDLRRSPSLSRRRNVCNLSDSKLGKLFHEFNVRFYRLCHV